MKKMIIASALVLTLAITTSPMAAGFNSQPTGGFKGPGLETSTVKQALTLSDDTPVVLVGQIERAVGNEKYIFKDATGSVTVDIDNEDWRGLTVTPQDTIVIEGEVDKDFFKTEIDVDTVSLKK